MQTIQLQPGRCRGCLVVAPTDGSAESPTLSPRTAALAKASKPEGSRSRADLWLPTILRFLKSGEDIEGAEKNQEAFETLLR